MSWTQQLYQTYEKLSSTDCGLTPIAHMYAKAQLEVVLNQNSEYVSAYVVGRESEKTLIPVTEASSGRSSGTAPHALCDTLAYLAGDFGDYLKEKKEKQVTEKKHAEYMKALAEWCSSSFANPKAIIILEYLTKNCLMQDLISADLVHVEGGLYLPEKINGNEYGKVLVRFQVLDGSDENRTWEDKTLIKAYTSYYLASQSGASDICYVTGQNQIISENHPKSIVSAYGNAKLISANDTSGYTFRGRFENSMQASSVSYEASQKIHGALKWLVSNQGMMIGTKNRRTFLCWNPEGKKTGDLLNWLFEDETSLTSFAEDQKQYKANLHQILWNCRNQFDENDYIIVMGLDAATTGRLSVTYYQELLASNYWNNLSYWGKTVSWYFRRYEDNQAVIEVKTPEIWRIIACAYGTERDSGFKVDDLILREHAQRLLKCMIEKQRIPRDIILSLVQKASKPLAYSTRSNREMVLSVACALLRKDFIDRGIYKEDDESNMMLDNNNTDRSYLYGRMLAVYEKIERQALDRDDTREPNAIRLQAAFVNHPKQTWGTLEGAVKPYLNKLKPNHREYYRQLLAEIVSKFEEDDFGRMNQNLSETYLLGYYLQRKELNTRKSEKEESKNE